MAPRVRPLRPTTSPWWPRLPPRLRPWAVCLLWFVVTLMWGLRPALLGRRCSPGGPLCLSRRASVPVGRVGDGLTTLSVMSPSGLRPLWSLSARSPRCPRTVLCGCGSRERLLALALRSVCRSLFRLGCGLPRPGAPGTWPLPPAWRPFGVVLSPRGTSRRLSVAGMRWLSVGCLATLRSLGPVFGVGAGRKRCAGGLRSLLPGALPMVPPRRLRPLGCAFCVCCVSVCPRCVGPALLSRTCMIGGCWPWPTAASFR